MMTFPPYGIVCLVPFTSYMMIPGSWSIFFAATTTFPLSTTCWVGTATAGFRYFYLKIEQKYFYLKIELTDI